MTSIQNDDLVAEITWVLAIFKNDLISRLLTHALVTSHRGRQVRVIVHKKNQPAAKGQQGPAMQHCQLRCQQITARGSAKKDELMKFPTSSLFCDLYWKVILYWTSWTVSQA